MFTILIALSCLVVAFLLYIALGVYLLWRLPSVKVEELWLDPKDLFPPLVSFEQIQKTQEAVEKDPMNPTLRRQLTLELVSRLGTERGENAELTKLIFPQIVWFIRNYPFKIPQSSTLLHRISEYLSTEQNSILISEWDACLQKNNFKPNFLKAASHFYMHYAVRISFEYNEILLAKYPFEASALSNRADFLNTRSYLRTDGCYNPRKSLAASMEIFNLPWRDVNNYRLTEFIDRYGKLFGGKLFWFPVFSIYAYLFCLLSDGVVPLGMIGSLALDLNDSDAIQEISNRLSEALPEAEKSITYLPFLSGPYNFFGRLAVKYEDLETLELYLKKKTHNEVSSKFSFMFHDGPLIEDIYTSKYNYLLRGYLEACKRADHDDVSSDEIPIEIEELINGTSSLYSWNNRKDPYT